MCTKKTENEMSISNKGFGKLFIFFMYENLKEYEKNFIL